MPLLVIRGDKAAADGVGAWRPLTHVEIGARLGISRGLAWKLEHRALAKIKAELLAEAEAAGVTLHEFLFGDDGNDRA
jgi:hypothetical protein